MHFEWCLDTKARMGLKLGDHSFTCSDVSAQIKNRAFNEKVRVCIFFFPFSHTIS